MADECPKNLVNRFLEYLTEISVTKEAIFRAENKHVFKAIRERIDTAKEKRASEEELMQKKNIDTSKLGHDQINEVRRLQAVQVRLNRYASELTVMSFNGGRYDLNLIKEQLLINLVTKPLYEVSYPPHII